MRDQSNQAEASSHQKVWELLPWYVNGTLTDPELSAVRQHISSCQICQDEIVQCQSIAAAVRSTEGTEWKPTPEHLARLMVGLDHENMPTIPVDWSTRVREWLQRNLKAVQIAPSPLRWTLAMQTTMIVLLAGTVVWQAAMSPQLYRTLSEGGTAFQPGRTYISVVFADDITEGELRTLLSTVQGTIVAGPSPLAVYIVSVPGSGAEPDARASMALDTLRKHPKVRLAELRHP
jgi:hypothetical protein